MRTTTQRRFLLVPHQYEDSRKGTFVFSRNACRRTIPLTKKRLLGPSRRSQRSIERRCSATMKGIPGTAPSTLAKRLRSQRLTGPKLPTAEQVVRHLLAVQAQDTRGMRLALRPRSHGLRSADVGTALSLARSLVVSWLNRGTLHLVAAADYWWLHPLTTPPLGPRTRRELRVALDRAGVPTAGQGLVHLLVADTLRWQICARAGSWSDRSSRSRSGPLPNSTKTRPACLIMPPTVAVGGGRAIGSQVQPVRGPVPPRPRAKGA